MKLDMVVETKLSTTSRIKQLSAMFDVPLQDTAQLEWHADLTIEAKPWNVGLIVGPSGTGKTLTLRKLFGEEIALDWGAPSVIDDFAESLTMEEIAAICSAVGFNTVPAWMRPYGVLSNGEQFRVRTARAMLETPPDQIMAIDEFTSVVDRQVAEIGSYAVQKWIRRNDRQFVAASCHYDIIDWLQPDWIFEPATATFSWRSVQPRPQVNVEIQRVDHSTWEMFAPFHYLTNHLHKGAQCYVLFANGDPAAFAGMLHRPHPKVKDIIGCSRMVTLPDWQGLGLSHVLSHHLGACYKAIGKRMRIYPAHPALIHLDDRSPEWALKQRPGYMKSGGAQRTGDMNKRTPKGSPGNTKTGPNAKIGGRGSEWAHGSRPCAVFEYCGEAWPDVDDARRMLEGA